jgi:hypothetical protein
MRTPLTKRSGMTEILKAGTLYFLLVFGAGFVLGPIRVLWAVPRFGVRTAELIEAPIMLLVIVSAAGWIGRRYGSMFTRGRRLAVGLLALGLLLVAELGVVYGVRGLTLAEYAASRDPVAGAVYIVLLILYAVMPALVALRETERMSGADGS